MTSSMKILPLPSPSPSLKSKKFEINSSLVRRDNVFSNRIWNGYYFHRWQRWEPDEWADWTTSEEAELSHAERRFSTPLSRSCTWRIPSRAEQRRHCRPVNGDNIKSWTRLSEFALMLRSIKEFEENGGLRQDYEIILRGIIAFSQRSSRRDYYDLFNYVEHGE